MLFTPTRLYCPNCKIETWSASGPEARLRPVHVCPKLRGLIAPLYPVGVKAKVVAHDREDYEGGDVGHTALDENGRPVMSIETIRDDGTDLAVFAPSASVRVE